MRLGIDPKQADQLVRGSIVLPHGIGRTLRAIVFAKGDKIDEAREAGADEVGGQELAEKIKEGWTLMPVVVANRDIVEGSVLDYEMVAKMQMPEQFVTPSVVAPEQFEKVIGQKLMVPLQRGDLILWSHFRSEGTFERLSNIVRKAGRAISLDIGGASAVAGWVRPNDHIDILGTFMQEAPSGRKDKETTITLLQNVVVLATGQLTSTRSSVGRGRVSSCGITSRDRWTEA